MKQPAQLVFIPAPGIGHLVSTVEIAKVLVSRDDSLFVTVLIMKLPDDKHFTNTDTVSQRINFINLPDTFVDRQAPGGFTVFIKKLIETHKPHVKDAVTKLLTPETEKPEPPRLAGFVVDMFCTPMIDVANEFGVPSYLFFTSSAASLGHLLHLQWLRDEEGEDVSELIDSGAVLAVPSFVNPLPVKMFPTLLLDKDGVTHFLNYGKRFRETKGILVNTFSELESHAVGSFSDGRAPPVYPVGPLLNLKNDDAHDLGSDKSKQKSDILKWLDDQPPLSVVFLCFGSMGSFHETQVKETACALEQSGARFLWSLRQPPSNGKMGMPKDYMDPTEVLPEGFLDRTAEIGKVIGWAPQVAILAHPAVGGFVSHCGWNSTLESLWHGVPVAAWPLYAEQQLNAFELVKELGLAVEVKIDYRMGGEMLVSAREIESAIRKVMEKDSEIREKVKEMSEKSKQSLMVGGSSYSSLGRFIDQI